ncbi:uncharacterized protein LOC110988124 [Acanthaster planci]|uniref:Uncharacterized protein LOC110988124 n=1 Tax=Acanthaster planci TaxID=133434 RepID=A0A8B7ZNS7_ACAPL|nr:uncharacterized protein LOC110988124 [Acanthaster planci]
MAVRFIGLVLLSVLDFVVALERGEYLDMSYGYDENSLAYPGAGFFQLTIEERGPALGLPWLEYNSMCLPEHIGTHVDAPSHFGQGKMRIDDIPLSRLICSAVRVDISEKAKADRDYGMTVKDLQDWEVIHGKIPDGSLLFVYTGWGAFYPDRLAYLGTKRNDTHLDDQGMSLVHCPGVGPEAAEWLVANRKIVGLGTDSANIDRGLNVSFPTHRILMEANIYGIENVANLDQLPDTGAKVFVLPMKIVDGSGAPARIVAMLNEDSTSGAATLSTAFVTCVSLLTINLLVLTRVQNQGSNNMAARLPVHITYLTLLGLVLSAALVGALKPGELLDMTYVYDNETTLRWPGAPPFEQTILSRGPTPSMPWLEMNKISTAEHFGTHLDAPAHTAKGKWRTDEIPVENLIGPAVRVDVSSKAKADVDYRLTQADLTEWVSANGPIPAGALLFVYTGFGDYWSDRLQYFGYAGTDDYIDADGKSLLHFPGISVEAATWLVENTKVTGVGIDTASLDFGQSLAFEAHQVLLTKNIFGLENVANLDQLPTKGATVYALPMKIWDGSGGPVRIIATGGSSLLQVDFAALLLIGISMLLKTVI